MQRWFRASICAVSALLVVAAHATAQTLPTQIAGVVKDSSGGVMPGVTVEAASDVLIEKVRTAVSDEHGEYKIVDLRPGTYSVTFSLTGFSTIKRDGIELTSGFAAKIDAEMRVGSLEETLTVSGQSPVVDVQNTSQIKTVSAEMLYALPLTKEMGGLAKVTVGVMIPPTAQDVGGNIDPMNAYPVIHGGRTADNRALLDGMQFNGEGQGRGFYFNPAAAQEASVQLGGQTAEFENGGFQANMIPKDGGNLFSGLFSGNYAGKGLVSDNLTQELRDRGLTQVNKAQRTYDANAAVGGPIFQDKLWFFTAHRVFGYQNLLAGNYYNLTPGTPVYTPDFSRPALHQQDNWTDGVRFTYQLSSKDKIAAAWDIQHSDICLYCSPLRAPEATPKTKYADPNYLLQAKWSRIITPKLFFEAADSTLIFNWPNRRKDGGDGISIFNANTGYRYNAPQASELGQRVASQSNQRASLSYVTGSHAFKFGFTTQEAFHHAWYDDAGPGSGLGNGLTAYTFFNNLPNAITQFAEPVLFDERLKVNLGLYAQDQWTVGKFTLNLGLRYDYFNAYVPEQNLSEGPFVPARSYPKVECVPCWKDINPRAAVAYDIFGNGRSALKVNFGRYVMADIYTMARANNPVTRAVLNATRTWTDSNGNFAPDCNLANFSAQNNTATGGDICGALNNVNFGRNNPNAVTFADDTRLGFGSRPHNWQTQITFDQQLRSNISLGVGYFRTSWGGFNANQNVALAAGTVDFNPYCVTAPTDSRLPNGGGYEICGLYDVVPAKFGQSTIVTQKAATEGGNVSEIYNGFDVVLNVRLPRRININGGLNTGRTVTDNCGLTLSNLQFGLPNVPHTEEYCRVTPPWSASTQVKFSGAFPLPYDFQLATTFQDLPGIPWSNWSNTATNLSTFGLAAANFTSAQVAQSLGRPLSAGANATIQVPLIAPATKYEGRIRQLDFRFSRIFRVGKTRMAPEFDIYNALNASPVLALNTNYGAAFLRPTQILAGRLLKFGMQVTF
ncbi:MAG: carboxypeptidase regulatory-like domain-containing protein [Vicinamibacterales bacterium]